MTARILIVDDVAANLNALSDTLEPQGYHILAARSGEQAIDAATRNRPDLILLDVMMPGLDGYETCRRLKANEVTRSIPIIFLTVQDEVEKVVEGFRAGGVDYVTKPFQTDELLIRIPELLTWGSGKCPLFRISRLHGCQKPGAVPFPESTLAMR